MWFFAVLIVLLIGAIAVVAAGSGGSMSEEYDDRPDVRVQADGPLTAQDLREVRFTTAVRGYRASEVDGLLARLIEQLDIDRAPEPQPQPQLEPEPEPEPEPASEPDEH
jgi:DivIVA domain-containing protein